MLELIQAVHVLSGVIILVALVFVLLFGFRAFAIPRRRG